MKVTVVEDDEVIRQLIQYKLIRMGHQVMSFTNGEDALSYLLQNPTYDLIITDIMMPRMGGIELAKNVRRVNDLVPIVAITGGSIDFGPEADNLFSMSLEKNVSIDYILSLIFKTFDSTTLN